jgi:1,2-phenylacetyl-CoA epoxidase catalytic subunit
MFPIDKRTAQMVWYPAPDVIPQICFAVDDVPMKVWNSTTDLYELADKIEPYLEKYGARKWDFIWSMERHFSEPYGPLPKAKQTFMAGIPDMFLQEVDGLPETASGTYDTGDGGVLGEQLGMNVVKQDDVEVLARPYQYEADSDMPDEYRFWLEKLFFAHGECMMPYFGPAAKGHRQQFAALDEFSLVASPTPEARLRMMNFTAEEFKHTYQFFKVYNAFDPQVPVRIYEHEREVFRAYESMKAEPTWLDRSINNMMSDRFGVYQGFEWVQSSYAPLARVSLKVVKDERGHSNCGYLNVREIFENDPSMRAKAQERINEYWYPYFMAAFGSSNSKNNRAWRKWGLKQHTNDALRIAYHVEMQQVLESLGLETPDFDKSLARGLELAGRAMPMMAGS